MMAQMSAMMGQQMGQQLGALAGDFLQQSQNTLQDKRWTLNLT